MTPPQVAARVAVVGLRTRLDSGELDAHSRRAADNESQTIQWVFGQVQAGTEPRHYGRGK
jgi:hypothetical protein